MRTGIFFTLLFLAMQCSFAQSYSDLCKEGEKQLENKEYKQAAATFSRAGNAAKNKIERLYTLSNKGLAQSLMNNHEQAAETFAQALAIEPTSPTLLLQRGNSLLQIDSVDSAVRCYNKILEQLPDNRDARFFRAYAYSLLGEHKESKLDYIKLISANSEDKEARLGLAVLYQREGNINESLMMLETLIEEYPDEAEFYVARCNLEREQGQLELALQDINKAIEIEPQNAAHRTMQADVLQQLGYEDAARRSRNIATKISTTTK